VGASTSQNPMGLHDLLQGLDAEAQLHEMQRNRSTRCLTKCRYPDLNQHLIRFSLYLQLTGIFRCVLHVSPSHLHLLLFKVFSLKRSPSPIALHSRLSASSSDATARPRSRCLPQYAASFSSTDVVSLQSP
jgi:hypothetical protein